MSERARLTKPARYLISPTIPDRIVGTLNLRTQCSDSCVRHKRRDAVSALFVVRASMLKHVLPWEGRCEANLRRIRPRKVQSNTGSHLISKTLTTTSVRGSGQGMGLEDIFEEDVT